MKFKAHIDVMTREEILDPQGKVVTHSLHNMGLGTVSDVRIGKHIVLEVEAANEAAANDIVDSACKKLLANLIMERYSYRLEQAEMA